MVEKKDFERLDFTASHKERRLTVRIVSVRLWDDGSEEKCSRFNVQVKLRNNEAKSVIDEDWLDGGTWTVIAHSDHNPNGGHNIRDVNDEKQLHIDIHPSITDEGYNETWCCICDGSPPETNQKAIEVVENCMRNNFKKILDEYLNYFKEN